MKKIHAALLGATLMLGTATASAEGFYGVGQLSYTNWSVPDTDQNNTVGAGFGVGLDLNQWAAVEINYDNLGKGNSHYVEDGVPGEDVISATAVTVWAVADPKIGEVSGMPVRFVGRVGIAYTSIAIDIPELENAAVSFNDQAVAYGAGFAIGISESSDIIVDYRHRNSDYFNVELDSVTLVFKHTF